jgi:LysM repeat protein
MRWRTLAFVSLGVNLVLAAVWLNYARHSSGPGAGNAGAGESAFATPRTKILLHRQFFSWQELESGDYPTYIANLRSIGCPEQTIRDIIIADVDALYAWKRATNVITPDQQWWRSVPDTNVMAAAIEKARALDDERRALLAKLLGPDWESGDLANLPRPSRQGVALDGPVLGNLTPETKQAVEQVSQRSEERLQAYLDAQRAAGRQPDPVDLAKLRKQTRDDLASVLSPSQLEEFLLRYSQYANNLRADFGTLRFFEPTPDEFRSVFRATDSIDQQIQMLADATDPNSVLARKNLLDARENALKQALGTQRYGLYHDLQDPLYRDAMQTALDNGTPDAVNSIYAANLAAASEQQDVMNDPSLTATQKDIALKSIQLDQLKVNAAAIGQDLPAPATPPPQPRVPTYTLRPGDTPAVIAMIYGVPQSALMAANPGVNFNRLKPGDAINIPRTALAPIGAPLIAPGLAPSQPPP